MSRANGSSPVNNPKRPSDSAKPGAIQIESELEAGRAEQRKRNTRKRGGVELTCDRCEQLLAVSHGDHLDLFSCTIWHRVKLKCEACGHERRWGPGKGTAYNADLNTEAPKIEDAPLPKNIPAEQTLDGDKSAE